MNNASLGAATNNVLVGWGVGTGITTASNNLKLGYGVGATLATGAREILLGTAATCDVGSSSETDTFKLCFSTTGGSLMKGSLVAATPSMTEFGTLSIGENTGTDTTAASNSTSASCNVSNTCHNNAGRFKLGTGPNTSFVLTFNTNTFAQIPVCFAQDETTNVTMRATSVSTASATFTASGTMTANDLISYQCMGL